MTVRVADPPPGEAAEVDFGRLGLWPDPATGSRRSVYGLLVTLAFSRYAFLWVALRQDLPTVLTGLEAAWAFFQGVVHRLVVDNLKPVVTRADRYAPQIDRVFLEYAQHRGFLVDPAVPRHATGKPKVERGIPYVRQDFFRGEVFRDLEDMQAHAERWCRELAGTRIRRPGGQSQFSAQLAVQAATGSRFATAYAPAYARRPRMIRIGTPEPSAWIPALGSVDAAGGAEV